MPLPPYLLDQNALSRFTHKGWIFGFVPIYVAEDGVDGAALSTRNWCPEFVMDLGEAMHTFSGSLGLIDDSFFEIRITGELHAEPT